MKPSEKPLWLYYADNVGWDTACRVASSLRSDSRTDTESIKREYEEVLGAVFRLKSGAPL